MYEKMQLKIVGWVSFWKFWRTRSHLSHNGQSVIGSCQFVAVFIVESIFLHDEVIRSCWVASSRVVSVRLSAIHVACTIREGLVVVVRVSQLGVLEVRSLAPKWGLRLVLLCYLSAHQCIPPLGYLVRTVSCDHFTIRVDEVCLWRANTEYIEQE